MIITGRADVTISGFGVPGGSVSLTDVAFTYDPSGWRFNDAEPSSLDSSGGTLSLDLGQDQPFQSAEIVTLSHLDGPQKGEQSTFNVGSKFHSKRTFTRDSFLITFVKSASICP